QHGVVKDTAVGLVLGDGQGAAVEDVGGNAHAGIVIDAAAGAQDGAAVGSETPGEAEPGSEVAHGGLPDGLRTDDGDELLNGRIVRPGGAAGERRGTVFPAKSDGDRQSAGYLPGVFGP